MRSTVVASEQNAQRTHPRLALPQECLRAVAPGRISNDMSMLINSGRLTAIVTGQEWHVSQPTFFGPHERKNRRSRIRYSGDFSGVVDSICGTVVSARENIQLLRLRVGMTPESGPRCSFATVGFAANDISQIVQFGWDLSPVFVGKLRDDIFGSLA